MSKDEGTVFVRNRLVLAWLVARPDTEWFSAPEIARGAMLAEGVLGDVLDALNDSGDVEIYRGHSGPTKFYATTKARREAALR